MPANLRVLSHLPVLFILAYLASGAELYINFVTGIPPFYGELICLGGLLAALGVETVTVNGRNLLLPSAVRAIYAILLVYGFVTVVSFTYSVQNDVVVDTLFGRIKTIIFLVVVSLLLIEPTLRSRFTYVAALVAIVGSLLSIFDFIVPTFSSVPGRGAGFYLNSNETGAMLLVMALIGSTRLRVLPTYVLWSITTIGILVTFSRSAWIMLFLSLIGITFLGKLGGGRARYVFLIGVGAMLALVLATYLSGDLYAWVSKSSLAEYLDPNTLARLGSRGVAIDDYSSLEREDVFRFGMEKFLDSPFIGWGVGYGYVWAESVGTHNMPLALAVDFGIIGPILYFALFAVLIARTRGLAWISAAVLFMTGQSTHNQLEFLADAMAIAYVIATTSEYKRRPAAPRAPRRRPAATQIPRQQIQR
ncbi:MAG: O-antigen ligase family protein [Croceibacterium sp.]